MYKMKCCNPLAFIFLIKDKDYKKIQMREHHKANITLEITYPFNDLKIPFLCSRQNFLDKIFVMFRTLFYNYINLAVKMLTNLWKSSQTRRKNIFADLFKIPLVILSWAAEARFWLLDLPGVSPSFFCCFNENNLIIFKK